MSPLLVPFAPLTIQATNFPFVSPFWGKPVPFRAGSPMPSSTYMPKNFGINYHLQIRHGSSPVVAQGTASVGAHPPSRPDFISMTGNFKSAARSGLATPSSSLPNATTNPSGVRLAPVTTPSFTRSAARLVVVSLSSTRQFALNSPKSPKMRAYVSTEKSPSLNSPQPSLLLIHMTLTTLIR